MSKKPVIFGISSTGLTEDEKELLVKNPVTGFILFARNIQDREQLLKLIQDLRSLYTHDILIFVDQEGGRVARLKPPFVDKLYPPAAYFGQMYDQQGVEAAGKAVFDNYSDLMKGIKGYNIDSPCCPVADLHYSGASSVIGDRSFGSSVDKVVYLCSKSIEAIEGQGGIPIIKHMPGHGRATVDSHYKLPYVNASLDDLNKTDFEVFRQLSNNYKTVWAMSAHIVFEALDSHLPITLSSVGIKFLRKDIGFNNTLVTDDICMLALHGDIGVKYDLVKKCASNYPITDDTINELIKYGLISEADRNNQLKMLEHLEWEFPLLKEAFIASVAKVAKQAITAGCDTVLHCSGDIQEMTAVCQAL